MKINAKKTDLNVLAREITKLEGGKVELSIAQVKEVLRCLGDVLVDRNFMEVMAIIYKLIQGPRK